MGLAASREEFSKVRIKLVGAQAATINPAFFQANLRCVMIRRANPSGFSRSALRLRPLTPHLP
jgi:hypothetical protein